MSEHVWTQNNIAAYVAGGLEPKAYARLEAHLAGCEECAALAEETMALDRKLMPLFAAAHPEADLEDRLVQTINALPRPARYRPLHLSGKFKVILGIAAALLLACVGLLVEQTDSLHSTPKQSSERSHLDLNVVGKGSLDEAESNVNSNKGVKRDKDSFREPPGSTKNGVVGGGINPSKEYQYLNELARNFDDGRADKSGQGEDLWKERKPTDKGPDGKDELESVRKLLKEQERMTDFTDQEKSPGRTGPAPVEPSLKAKRYDVAGDRAEKHFKHLATIRDQELKSLEKTPPPTMPALQPLFETFDSGKDSKKDDKSNKGDLNEPPANDGQARDLPKTNADKKPDAQQPLDGDDGRIVEQPKLPQANRKVIYTAKLEFEVQSFDAALDTIKRIKGVTSIIATTNKDKLPNGKMRGIIVLRVLPDRLEDLVSNLIVEITSPRKGDTRKQGELKNQHLHSDDVTKHYTDLESELRAKRTMEDRLNAMIKDVKGTVKDLLEVEIELGKVRKRIEEIEGELRYYANLVAMSTLTIELYEKDIGSAAQVIKAERVQAAVATENVDRHISELEAKAEKKGRVIFSDLKQKSLGRSFLHFEVPKALKKEFLDELHLIDPEVRVQIDMVQFTEDGAPTRKTAVIFGDTQFMVTFQSMASMTPQETIVLRLAVMDVKAAYEALSAKIDAQKGLARISNAVYNDKDRTNINAQIDFDVNRAKEPDILAVLQAGDTLQRNVSRVPNRDDVSNARVRYLVTMIDADSLLPRDKKTLKIAAGNVSDSYRKLRDSLSRIKIREIVAQDDKNEAVFVFTYRNARSEDEEVVKQALKAAGDVITSKQETNPAGADLTSAKTLVQVTLIPADSVKTRETFLYRIASSDVAGTFDKLQTIVGKAQSRVTKSEAPEKIRQDDELKGWLSFEVPSHAAAELRAKVETAGEIVFYARPRAEGDDVTDSRVRFVIEVVDVLSPALKAQERIERKIAVSDVPAAFNKLQQTLKSARARVYFGKNDKDAAGLSFAYLRGDEQGVNRALEEAGETLGVPTVTQAQEKPNVSEKKVEVALMLVPAATSIDPAQSATLTLEVTDVSGTLGKFDALVKETVKDATGRIDKPTWASGKKEVTVVYLVPLASYEGLLAKFRATGIEHQFEPSPDPLAPQGKLALARFKITLTNTPPLVTRDDSLGAQMFQSLSTSLKYLFKSVGLVITGLLVVGPWLPVGVVLFLVVRRNWRNNEPSAPTSAVEVPTTPPPSEPHTPPPA